MLAILVIQRLPLTSDEPLSEFLKKRLILDFWRLERKTRLNELKIKNVALQLPCVWYVYTSSMKHVDVRSARQTTA